MSTKTWGGKAARKAAFLALTVLTLHTGPAVAARQLPVPGHKPERGIAGPKPAAAQAGTLSENLLAAPSNENYGPEAQEAHVQARAGNAAPPLPWRKPARRHSGPLSDKDVALYRRIFALQSGAKWAEADAALRRLGDYRLRGDVLYDRYMHPDYKSSFEELASWLDLYSDHPGAARIYRLAVSRKPAGFTGALTVPVRSAGTFMGYLPELSQKRKPYVPAPRSRAASLAVRKLSGDIRQDLSKGAPSRALRRLRHDDAAQYLDTVEYDQLQARIAGSYLYSGHPDKARELALASAGRSGRDAPLAGWIGGLASWRAGDYKDAARLFEQVATSPYASSWSASAGAYWASRAHLRTGEVRAVNEWLRKAAAYPRTFYGMIATRALGWDFDFNWESPALDRKTRGQLEKISAVRRAQALAKVGQYQLAERALAQYSPASADQKTRQALVGLSTRLGLPSFALQAAESISAPDGKLYDSALYPLCPWVPESGFKVDRALIHALIRQESRFDPQAQSHSGATGLMQLMPATASAVTRDDSFRSGSGLNELRKPEVNLEIGQRYVQELLVAPPVNTELFSLLIAYNAGPGNLARWKEQYADMKDDPLLFIESIPMAETRSFVEHVMANYWIYRARLDQEAPSLDAVAEGRWAEYVGIDGKDAPAVPVRPEEPDHPRGLFQLGLNLIN
jgi:soluble lytic murein transglycosylase-like protein